MKLANEKDKQNYQQSTTENSTEQCKPHKTLGVNSGVPEGIVSSYSTSDISCKCMFIMSLSAIFRFSY